MWGCLQCENMTHAAENRVCVTTNHWPRLHRGWSVGEEELKRWSLSSANFSGADQRPEVLRSLPHSCASIHFENFAAFHTNRLLGKVKIKAQRFGLLYYILPPSQQQQQQLREVSRRLCRLPSRQHSPPHSRPAGFSLDVSIQWISPPPSLRLPRDLHSPPLVQSSG